MFSRLTKALKGSYFVRFLAWLFILNWVDTVALALPKRISSTLKKRVIFLKMDGIGDYVIWTSTFDALEKIYPSNEYERILVGNGRFEELAKDQSLFDKKIFVDWERFIFSPLYRFRLIRQIRNLGADVILNPRLTREFLWSDSIVRLSGASVRIGSAGLDNQMPKLHQLIGNRIYTTLVAAPSNDEHELVSHRRFLQTAFPNIQLEILPPQVSDRFKAASKVVSGDYAVLFLGAYSVQRIWPIEKYAIVANTIVNEYGLRIVVCGGPGEEYLTRQFEFAFGGEFLDLIGKTTLAELGRVLSSAKLVVTNDTSAAHISTVSGTPTVVLTPGNQVGRFFPYPALPETRFLRQVSVFHPLPCFGCGWHCVHKDFDETRSKPCVELISVEDAVAAIAEILGDNRKG